MKRESRPARAFVLGPSAVSRPTATRRGRSEPRRPPLYIIVEDEVPKPGFFGARKDSGAAANPPRFRVGSQDSPRPIPFEMRGGWTRVPLARIGHPPRPRG